jgi:hypothetical protein
MNNQSELNKSYTALFNGATKLIEEMEMLTRKMRALQQEAEEIYLDQTEESERGFTQGQGA